MANFGQFGSYDYASDPYVDPPTRSRSTSAGRLRASPSIRGSRSPTAYRDPSLMLGSVSTGSPYVDPQTMDFPARRSPSTSGPAFRPPAPSHPTPLPYFDPTERPAPAVPPCGPGFRAGARSRTPSRTMLPSDLLGGDESAGLLRLQPEPEQPTGRTTRLSGFTPVGPVRKSDRELYADPSASAEGASPATSPAASLTRSGQGQGQGPKPRRPADMKAGEPALSLTAPPMTHGPYVDAPRHRFHVGNPPKGAPPVKMDLAKHSLWFKPGHTQ